METTTSFKFLFDNLPCSFIQYYDLIPDDDAGSRNPKISYLVWDNSKLLTDITPSRFYSIEQTNESMTSCMTPVQSIVIVSENIPVVEELSTPLYLLQDSDSSAFASATYTTALTQKVIGNPNP